MWQFAIKVIMSSQEKYCLSKLSFRAALYIGIFIPRIKTSHVSRDLLCDHIELQVYLWVSSIWKWSELLGECLSFVPFPVIFAGIVLVWQCRNFSFAYFLFLLKLTCFLLVCSICHHGSCFLLLLQKASLYRISIPYQSYQEAGFSFLNVYTIT